MKKIIVISDLHAGHCLGFARPPFNPRREELIPLRKEFYEWFKAELGSVGSVDYCFNLGDNTDGEGKRGNMYHDTTDVGEQIDEAIEILKMIPAKKHVMVYGTDYHTGRILEYEKVIAEKLGCDIRSEQRVSVNGVKFNLAHQIGKSGVPRGGDIQVRTKQLQTILDDVLNSNKGIADIVIRGHAHEWRYVENALGIGIICPAMKLGLKDYEPYARKIGGYYTVGFLEFNVNSADDFGLKKHFFKYKLGNGGYRKL